MRLPDSVPRHQQIEIADNPVFRSGIRVRYQGNGTLERDRLDTDTVEQSGDIGQLVPKCPVTDAVEGRDRLQVFLKSSGSASNKPWRLKASARLGVTR